VVGIKPPHLICIGTHTTRAMTAGTLTLSFKESPFPYAAIAIASYTQTAEVNYDQSASGLTLTIEGTQITSEEDAVKALAKAGGLGEDSVKVQIVDLYETHV
jgi:glutamyl-tRNA synthetase